MSLINQMLRDLDARRAAATDRPAMPTAVHAAQARSGSAWLPLVVGAVLIGAAAAGTWYWLAGKGQAPVPQAAVVPQSAAPAAPGAIAPVPAVQAQPQAQVPVQASVPAQAALPPPQVQAAAPPQTLPVPRAEQPAATQVSAAAPVTAQSPEAPRRSSPGPIAQAPAAKAAAPAVPRAASAASTKPAASKAAAASGVAPSAETEGSIEKRPHSVLANEAAENEYNKAIAALKRGENPEAVAGLQSALRLDARHVFARQTLLSLLVRQQQWGQAATLAEEGLALLPAQTPWAVVLARLQAEAGKLSEATDVLARHAHYAERNADYQALRAVLLQKQKRFHEASEYYMAAVSLRATEGRWWYGLGISLEGDQRLQEAREAFRRAKEAGNLPPELAASLKSHLQ